MLASCGADIKYLEWPSCKVRNTYKNAGSINSSYFRCISWCSNGKKLATVPDGNFPIIIDPNELEDYTGMQYQEIQVPRVNTLAFSKKRPQHITLGCETGHIFQYDIRDKSIHIISSLPSPVTIVKYSIADESLAASCKGGQIYLFNANEKLMSTYFVPFSWTISAMALHPNERNVLCGGSREGIVAVWDSASGNLKFQTHDHQSEITGLAFSPCDWLFASTSADYTLNMYDLRIKERIFYKMFGQKLSAVAFPSHGNQFVVGTQHGKVMTFDKRKLSMPKIVQQVHEGAVRQFAFQNENMYDDHAIEPVKICRSEISFKNEQPSISVMPVDSKIGSGDAAEQIEISNIPESIDSKTTKTESQVESWLQQPSSNTFTYQALLGCQEEICKCTEETLKSLVREMNEKFLRLWMSINKDLASLENKSEMRWKKFHSMIFDLGAQDSSGDCGIASIGSQTTATPENTATELIEEMQKNLIPNAALESIGKPKKKTFKMF